ncbi:MAG: DUF3137 domain-containing protein [Patescibacteria group bacterium]
MSESTPKPTLNQVLQTYKTMVWNDENLKDFKQFFESELRPQVSDLNRENKIVHKKSNVALIVLFVFLAAEIAVSAILKNPSVLALAFLTFGIFAIYYHFAISRQMNKVNADFKTRILPLIFKFLSPDGYYQPNINFEEFVESDLLNQLFDVYTSDPMVETRAEDKFEGKRNKIPFSFCELDLTKRENTIERYRDSEGKEQTRQKTEVKTVFHGLYMESKFLDSGYNGFTYVIDKLADRPYGINLPQGLEKVELESPEFNHYFGVFATDQVEARLALQTNLMYELTEFRKNYAGSIDLIIKPKDINVLLSTQKDNFELRGNHDLEEQDTYLSFLIPIDKSLDLIEIINTNRQDRRFQN